MSSSFFRDEGYASVEAFLEYRPDLNWVYDRIPQIVDEARDRFTTAATEPFWFGLSEEGKRLLAAALAIAIEFEIPPKDLVEALRIVVETWRRG